VTLLDWGSIESHVVPHFELIALILNNVFNDRPSSFNSFLRGYGLSVEEFRRSIESDMYDLLLLISVDKLRWAIDFNKPLKSFVQQVEWALTLSNTFQSMK
jgi:hypothetical protein